MLSPEPYTLSDGEKIKVRTVYAIKRSVQVTRQKQFPENPKSAKEIEIPEDWKTPGGASPENFLLHDFGSGTDSRFVIFGTKENVQHLFQKYPKRGSWMEPSKEHQTFSSNFMLFELRTIEL
ncbi:hypothetical protein LSTR_LSTR012043 [Laodelphax striatellus]|uniref:Uncharacterized protein n=1 Tax=Laodelphax striatellus TaxID=195883 RepID=A0A482WQ53_LAOST|nr:hypothetical protein LSTR_LSTR012043 [Laodelphax striatellus]